MDVWAHKTTLIPQILLKCVY